MPLGRYCGTVDVPAARLWVVKIRHDRFPKGMLYTLCGQHVVEFNQGDRDEYANDPQVPTCPIHFTRMLGGACDQCD